MLSNKNLGPIVTELFITGRKINFSLHFITQSYFAVPKNIRLNSTHHFIMKTTNKRYCHSSDISFRDFMKLSKNILQNHIPLRFRKNLAERN